MNLLVLSTILLIIFLLVDLYNLSSLILEYKINSQDIKIISKITSDTIIPSVDILKINSIEFKLLYY